MSTDASPLHKVIDARQWDAQGFPGRLMVVVHAAFIEAGFVPATSEKLHSAPWITGSVAATLSLRYTVPRRPSAVVWLLVRRDLIVLCSYLSSDGGDRWYRRRSVDARAIAPRLLSGGLDDTTRALESDARGVRLWEDVLADGICEPILDDLRVHPRPRPARRRTFRQFMSLPDDLIAAVLARLSGGEHLAVVECTCTKLRRLVADRDGELWRAMYDEKVRRVSATELQGRGELGGSDLHAERANRFSAALRELGDRTSTSPASWKVKYMRYLPDLWHRLWFSYRLEPTWLAHRRWARRQLLQQVSVRIPTTPPRRENNCRLGDPLETNMRGLFTAKSNVRLKPGGNLHKNKAAVLSVRSTRRPCVVKSNVLVLSGGNLHNNMAAVPSVQSTRRRRHFKGAIHSPSSRNRWMHR